MACILNKLWDESYLGYWSFMGVAINMVGREEDTDTMMVKTNKRMLKFASIAVDSLEVDNQTLHEINELIRESVINRPFFVELHDMFGEYRVYKRNFTCADSLVCIVDYEKTNRDVAKKTAYKICKAFNDGVIKL